MSVSDFRSLLLEVGSFRPKNWHEYFLMQASVAATKSKEKNTRVGAVVVGPDQEIRGTGFNGFPRGVSDADINLMSRDEKLMRIEHAERNSLYYASRVGVPLKGCSLYLNFAPAVCCDCAKGIIQVGIERVIGSDVKFSGKGPWRESVRIGLDMMTQSGIDVFVYDSTSESLRSVDESNVDELIANKKQGGHGCLNLKKASTQ